MTVAVFKIKKKKKKKKYDQKKKKKKKHTQKKSGSRPLDWTVKKIISRSLHTLSVAV